METKNVQAEWNLREKARVGLGKSLPQKRPRRSSEKRILQMEESGVYV